VKEPAILQQDWIY